MKYEQFHNRILLIAIGGCIFLDRHFLEVRHCLHACNLYLVFMVHLNSYMFYSSDKPQVDRYKEEESRKQEEESRKQESTKRHKTTDSKDEPTHKKHKSEYEHERKRKHEHERYVTSDQCMVFSWLDVVGSSPGPSTRSSHLSPAVGIWEQKAYGLCKSRYILYYRYNLALEGVDCAAWHCFCLLFFASQSQRIFMLSLLFK